MGCASSNAAEKGPSKPSAQQIKLENDERKGRVEVIKQYFTELTALHPFTTDKIATHSTEKSLWVIIDNRVHDCTQWQHGHPGGAKSIQQQGGKDATEVFHQLHGKTTKNNVASRTAPTYVGVVYQGVAVSSSAPHNIPEAFASAFEAPFVPTKAQVDLETSEAESRLKIVLEYLADITAAHPFTTDKIATHSTEKSLWVIIDNRVHDCTQWQHGHPGGAKSIQQQGGKDATEVFHQLHGKSTKDGVASRKAPTYVGVVYQGVRAGASSFADVPADFASAVEAPSTASATGTREPHQPAVAAKRAPAPQGHLDAYDFRPVKVGCVKRLTEDVVAVTLAFDDANYVLPILPGGHVSIEAPVPNADPAYRSYSPMSVSKGEATFVVRRYPGGKGSTYLHGRSVGDVVQVRGPIPPKYRLSEGATSTLVLLAGGTGAAPLFSIAREAARSRRVHLVLCFRTKDGALLVNESRDLATLIGGALTVSEVYSQEKPEAVAGMANTYSGRFNEATLRAILGTNAAAPADELVVCGPGPFNVAGETVGVALGFAKDRIAVMD